MKSPIINSNSNTNTNNHFNLASIDVSKPHDNTNKDFVVLNENPSPEKKKNPWVYNLLKKSAYRTVHKINHKEYIDTLLKEKNIKKLRFSYMEITRLIFCPFCLNPKLRNKKNLYDLSLEPLSERIDLIIL
jgi:hypothetical protein